jgi:hypothetical protein
MVIALTTEHTEHTEHTESTERTEHTEKHREHRGRLQTFDLSRLLCGLCVLRGKCD